MSDYKLCTLLFLFHLLKLFPLNQNKIPNEHHSKMRPAFVMIGGMKLYIVSKIIM